MIDENYLAHYGTPHQGNTPHSGRYEWGSGEDPGNDNSLRGQYNTMHRAGCSDKEIAETLGLSIREMKAKISAEKNEEIKYNTARAMKLKEHGYSVPVIAEKLGVSENTARKYLSAKEASIKTKNDLVKQELVEALEKNKYIDVGLGAEGGVAGGIARTRLTNAINNLKSDGYVTIPIQVDNLAAKAGNKTTILVMTKNVDNLPQNEIAKDIYKNIDKIGVLGTTKEFDGEKVLSVMKPPVSISSDRIQCTFLGDKDGNDQKDGTIEIRPGVKDLYLGDGTHYAQVRIAVDNKYYLKGVAVYNPDLPKGVDIRYNTSKPESDGKLGVLKKMKFLDEEEKQLDISNPFGASIRRQMTYIDDNGKVKQSPINIVNQEGDWDEWAKSLPSQFLSKQSRSLATRQLDIDLEKRMSEYNDIKKLSNPEIRKTMLEDFAGSCDTAAEELRGAALPRQAAQLILPCPSLKPNEIYAPNFKDGETVCLVRYPHGGTFEIPELVVNNRNAEGKRLIGPDGKDAVGIHPKAASQLSGADFDGDTAVVLPNNSKAIKSSSPIAELRDFDPKGMYSLKKQRAAGDETIPPHMTEREKGLEMGKITNLITDMTLGGQADQSEITRAVKHSMVIIDAYKHDLDFRRSYEENGIKQLEEKYQYKGEGKKAGGSGTIISRSKGPLTIDERRKYVKIDPETGEKIYENTGKTHYTLTDSSKRIQKAQDMYNKEGLSVAQIAKRMKVSEKTAQKYLDTDFEATRQWKEVANKEEITKMAGVSDARKLMSGYDSQGNRIAGKPEGTQMEYVYANYANKCKAMANEARKESLRVEKTKYNPEMAKVYAKEVSELKARVNEIEKNKPLERKVQAIASVQYNKTIAANPSIKDDKDKLKKARTNSVAYARSVVGDKAALIKPTDRQWEAILSGAVSSTLINKILDHSDSEYIKEKASPRPKNYSSKVNINTAKAWLNNGFTYAEVADAFGVSPSYLRQAIASENS